MLKWLLRTSPLAALAGALLAFDGSMGQALATPAEGHPSEGQIGLQAPATEVMREIHAFHDLTNIVIIAIAIFVLLLMIIVVWKFNEKSNPVPTTTTHNTFLEVAWTVIPIFILVLLAIPSFKLLMLQYTYPKPDLTIKATGNAWFWEHQYPDLGGFTITSNYVKDETLVKDKIATELRAGVEQAATNKDPKEISKVLSTAVTAEYTKRYGTLSPLELSQRLYDDAQPLWFAKKQPRLLAVDSEIVVPVNKVVHVLVTSNDVIHNWTIPSFGSKVDAVPGRVTSTWFRAEHEGIFYGQCSELCGLNHAFMPIGMRVVSEAVFAEWSGAMKAKDKEKAKAILDKVAALQDGRDLNTPVADASK
ncbi:MAG: cytochrome c oxidase subunit II transmembrane domain-containing protein [Hyphomicrobium sp.]